MSATFESLTLSQTLLDTVAELGYTEPTPIQVEAIPTLLAGRDLVGQSRTGSGKTAAFGLPILQRLDLESRSLQALVLCPTRELTGQVTRELRRLGRGYAGLSVVELIGGQPARPQRDALSRGVHVAVGTPGRVLDHLTHGVLDVSTLRIVVLDEADRMLDMGFSDEVGAILRELPRPRQTVLFSATFPDTIEAITKTHQTDALHVTIEAPPEELADIRQLQLVARKGERLNTLALILHRFPNDSALIFCNFKATVAQLAERLDAAGLSVDRLDGDLEQADRELVLARFRNQSVRILVATDVAGRGLDVEGLDLVINYELPQKPEIYVHRIGRTGRAGRQGVAISITGGPNDPRIAAAEKLTGTPIETFVREQGLPPTPLEGLAQLPKMATIRIDGGRRDKLRPGDILGALTGKSGGLRGSDVGKIEVHERLTYVAVALKVAPGAARQLSSAGIKNKSFRATLVGSPTGRSRR